MERKLDTQEEVLKEAEAVHLQRNASYRDVWRHYGALSNLLSAARKIDRLMELWWHNPDGRQALTKDALDDAFDAINYIGYFIRNARIGNLTGEPPERPNVEVMER